MKTKISKKAAETRHCLVSAGLLFLFLLFAPLTAHAVTEFVSVVDPDSGAGYDYSSLSAWEDAIEADLTDAGTLVIAGSLTRGAIGDAVAITQTTTGATATCIHHTTTQMMVTGMSGAPNTTDTWYPAAEGDDTTSAWTPTDAGDSVIAVAKCRSTGGSADTTAVTIDGWTTSATNYIKIWTDPTENYKHSGVWDASMYRLEISGKIALDLLESYVQIDGIQIQHTNSADNGQTISMDHEGTTYEVEISNNIFKGVDSARTYAVKSYNISGIVNIWSNLIYGYDNGSSGGLDCRGGNQYVYNNSVINNNVGISRSGGTVLAKNNLSYNNTTDYSGTFSASSTNNLSKDATAPAYNVFYTSKTITFVDTASDDYHLSPTDTAARNAGTDLSADANLAFSTDIDNETRSNHAWDIGADEAAEAIYRSVSPSATAVIDDDNTNTDTITITSGVAIFSADAATNVGVGDVILYDSSLDNSLTAADSIAFIKGRTDSTHFTIQDQYGAAPSDLAANDKWAVYRAYTSLANAEAGTVNSTLSALSISYSGGNRDLVANNEQWNIAAYANGTTADSTAVTIDGWTTAVYNYIKIYTPTETSEVGVSQRHSGKWDDLKYALKISSGDAIHIQDKNINIDGLQIAGTDASGNQKYINQDSGGTYGTYQISNNILKGVNGDGYNHGIYSNADAGSITKAWNNFIYDIGMTNVGCAGVRLYYAKDPVSIMYFHNNTINNVYMGIQVSANTMIAKNNIVKGSGNTNAYVGSFASGTDYNATDGTDSVGQGSNNKISQAFSFVDLANKDYHLSPTDIAARNAGTDLSADANLAFSTDIDGQTRSTIWEIGADEVGMFGNVGSVSTPASINGVAIADIQSISGIDQQ